MPRYILGCNPCVSDLGAHDPSAALFADGEILYAVEEERFTRKKGALFTFPINSIRQCLDYGDIDVQELDRIVVPWDPHLLQNLFHYNLKRAVEYDTLDNILEKAKFVFKRGILDRSGFALDIVEKQLKQQLNIDGPLPPIDGLSHHRSHAASVYYLFDMDDGLIITIDGRGEYDSTVVWEGKNGELERIRTWNFPNSLGFLYAMVTQFLGFRPFHDEGKVMGLAPYGQSNEQIRSKLLREIEVKANYDVTSITQVGGNNINEGVQRLERLFGRQRKPSPIEFTQWEKDLAYVVQDILEEIVLDVARKYVEKTGHGSVGVAGGIALNCKMNKRLREANFIEKFEVQPAAHDGGTILGAGALSYDYEQVEPMESVYLGDEFDTEKIRSVLEECKLNYKTSSDVASEVSNFLKDGKIVGLFQGQMEFGPRALGNRSILADPRNISVRDQVNEAVKHREMWRPFAPVIKDSAAEEYLIEAEDAPYMVRAFDATRKAVSDIPAVLHPEDHTARPQIVSESQNARLYAIIEEFEERTGVPVLLNTSFNDHGDPIVRSPKEAIQTYISSGLDVLVLEDLILVKNNV